MTYIDYLNEFNQWLESNNLPGNAQLLYFRLLNVFNRAGWPDHVQVDTRRLTILAECEKDAAYRARDRLKDAGFLYYRKGKKGSPTSYFLSYRATENATVSATENATENATHIKTKKKTKNISPTHHDNDYGFGEDLAAAFSDWLAYKRERRQEYKPTGLRSLVTQVQKHAAQYGEAAVVDLIRECMASNWQGIIWDKLKREAVKQQKPPEAPPRRTGRLILDENGEQVVKFD